MFPLGRVSVSFEVNDVKLINLKELSCKARELRPFVVFLGFVPSNETILCASVEISIKLLKVGVFLS